MKIKLFFGLSTLILMIALLMPVSVYAAGNDGNANSDLQQFVDIKPCLTIQVDIAIDDDSSSTMTEVTTDADTDGCDGGVMQMDVSWNSGGG